METNCNRCFSLESSQGINLQLVDFASAGIYVGIEIQDEQFAAILTIDEVIKTLAWITSLTGYTSQLVEFGRQVLLSNATSRDFELTVADKDTLKKAAVILEKCIAGFASKELRAARALNRVNNTF
jgi:hypothetical protein